MSKMPPAPRSRVNRRDFLRAATAAAVAPIIVPRHVVARSQTTPPSDRITLGFIGTGSMGGGHVRGFLKMPDVRILAISDIRLENLEKFQGAVNQQYGDSTCGAHPDFRELLARPDIDAVVIATGERWHPLDRHRGGAPREAHVLREAAQRHAGRRPRAARSGEEIRRGLPVGHAAALQRLLPAHGGTGAERLHRRRADHDDRIGRRLSAQAGASRDVEGSTARIRLRPVARALAVRAVQRCPGLADVDVHPRLRHRLSRRGVGHSRPRRGAVLPRHRRHDAGRDRRARALLRGHPRRAVLVDRRAEIRQRRQR